MTAAIRFHIQTDLSADDLGLLWRDLEARADITFFLSWHWIGAWIAELGECPPVLVGEASGALVLLGLLVPRRRQEAGVIRVNGLRLHTTGDRTKDCIAIEYNGFLVDRAWAGHAPREAAAWLLCGAAVGGRRRDELHIVAMTEQQARSITPPDAFVQMPYRKPSWRVDLAAIRESGRDYLDTLSANTRQQVRRSMRLYDADGGLTSERATDVPTALHWLDGLKELHQRQWQARDKPGGFAFPFFERFQRRLISSCIPRGTVELLRVRRGEQAIGYVYNLVLRGHVLAFVTGFLYEADKRLKPGLVCHALAINRHLYEGAAVYDFLAGETRYKSNLGTPGPDFVYLLLQRRTAATRTERVLRRGWERVKAASRHGPRRPSVRSESE
ncbi:MAG TPA: GNAT family N-acetyltransferase [Acetobacteraceae bacterium]|nr:GNAT family N-acetyltransferase [Acetobacteraceae bacterium]